MEYKSENKPTEYKTIPAFVKAVEGTEDHGIVEHLISVYGIEDLGGDVAHKGMFTKTVQERKDQIRVLDNHQHNSALNVVGKPLKFWEVGRDGLPDGVLKRFPRATGGMMVRTLFLMDTPEGKGTFLRIKAGALSTFSYAYEPIDYDFEELQNKRMIRHLRTIKLYEYGPVVFPMNEGAVSVSAKSEGKDIDEAETKNPWKVFEEDGEYCVYKVDSEGNKVGDPLGCHSSSSEAEEQIAALHSNVEDAGAHLTLEEKQNLAQYVEDVGSAFYYGVSGLSKYIQGVHEDYLIVSEYGKNGYWKVPYKVGEDGSFIFADEDAWVMGSLEFVPNESEEEPEKSVDYKRLLQIAELELEEINLVELMAEAGPE
jgi:uncharacterized protein